MGQEVGSMAGGDGIAGRGQWSRKAEAGGGSMSSHWSRKKVGEEGERAE